MPVNGENGTEEIAEAAEEIAEEIADEIADETAETDIDVTVIEAPEPEEPEAKFAAVDVGDLHISGPAEMVESITTKYLKDHIDHNPHTPVHDAAELVEETGEGVAESITPEPVEEFVQEQAAEEIVDNPPTPTDWLFRSRAGQG